MSIAASPAPSVRRLGRGLTLRANSLLITLFGDAIAPRRQSIWLGSLIRLVGLFGLSDRLVRTSAYRLSADDWLQATRVGRRSYYGLSPQGLQRVAHADRRIYEFKLPHWDGHWTLVLLPAGLRASARAKLRRELQWESFGQVASNVFAHPHVDLATLGDILDGQGALGLVSVLRARSLEGFGMAPAPQGLDPQARAPAGPPGTDALQVLMHQTYALAQVKQGWSGFIRRFEVLEEDARQLDGADAFVARTLLIHEYRRVVLRDPNLPESFLPGEWPGVRARALCETLYRQLLPASEAYLQGSVETLDGRLKGTPASIRERCSPGWPPATLTTMRPQPQASGVPVSDRPRRISARAAAASAR